MIGAVVENVSWKKLFLLFSCLLVVQIAFFLVGGLIAPQPTSSMNVLMRACHAKRSQNVNTSWIYLFPVSNCVEYDLTRQDDSYSKDPAENVDPNEIVFVGQIPLPRNKINLEYSPWFQWLLGLLMPNIEHDPNGHWLMSEHPELLLDVRLGYRNKWDADTVWHELIHTSVHRPLDCTLHEAHKNVKIPYNCTPIELFELGSNDYPFYLLNIRLPTRNDVPYNNGIGHLTELWLVAIHQNGGFTKVWLSMKTITTPFIMIALCWYWNRIRLLPRNPALLEKAIFALGVAMVLLNLPIEFLSLYAHMPFLLLISDIRQGMFYATLASFWLIFTGEHLMDDSLKNKIAYYWKQLATVLFTCSCLFLFDMCERGVHLTNPFYSIWSTHLGANLAYGFIILASICAVLYFCYLAYLIVRVMLTIKRRRATMQHLNRRKKLTYEGIIYRFKFLMCATLVCAALTVAGFVMNNVGEGQMHWGDFDDAPALQYTSAFFTGVYGMWNIYVFFLLALYAPSHKQYDQAFQLPLDDMPEDEIDPMAMTESSPALMLVKPATD